ncbi:MAG TPA: hypothetical protein DEA08_09275 [Planctomycetes bacterium]|nr:hypothetical protein [Planctomycetota bacterium]
MQARSRSLEVYLVLALLAAFAAAWLCVEAEAGELVARALRKEGAKREHYLLRAANLRAEGPRVVAALGPWVFALLALFHRGVRARLERLPSLRLAGLASGATLFAFLLLALEPARRPRLDPYLLTIAVALAGAAVGAGRALRRDRGLSAAALVIWLALWIPFDLRWLRQLWPGPSGLSYGGMAIWITTLAILGFGVASRSELGFRPPALRDLKLACGGLLAFGVVAIAIGLPLGFLRWNPQLDGPVLSRAIVHGLGLALTVALPEELFFRGVLDRGLEERFPKRPALTLAISSLAFGLMHWNNASQLEHKLGYVFLASIAGGAYGWVYRRSGALWAPVLFHTLIDLFWQLLLKR